MTKDGKPAENPDAAFLPFLLNQAKKKKMKVNKKQLDAEKAQHGNMLLTLANYNVDNRLFLERMEQQYSVNKTLDTLAKDIGYSQGRGKEKIDSIQVYEKVSGHVTPSSHLPPSRLLTHPSPTPPSIHTSHFTAPDETTEGG